MLIGINTNTVGTKIVINHNNSYKIVKFSIVYIVFYVNKWLTWLLYLLRYNRF